MKCRMFVALLVLSVMLLFATGCSQRIGAFTVISTKSFDVGTNYVKVYKDVSGTDAKPIIFIFPTGQPSIQSAVDDILSKYDGDVVGDAVVEYSWFYIPYIFGEYRYTIKGDIYKKAAKVSEMSPAEVSKMVDSDVKSAGDFYMLDTETGKVRVTKLASNSIQIDPATNKIFVKN